MPYDSCAVANFLLDYAEERRIAISNLTLLKLLYFAHGWHLVEHGLPLLLDEFQAWENGPVIPIVYHKFKRYGAGPITGRAEMLDAETGEMVKVEYSLDDSLKSFLGMVFDAYAPLGPFALSEKTHVPGSPWDALWNRGSWSVNVGMRVSNDLIKQHFLDSMRQ